MAIASRQLSRLKQQRQDLKAQQQRLKRETETLKAQEQTLKRQEQKLKDLLSTIESRKQTTPQKEPSTLNSLLPSLKSQNTTKDITNKPNYVIVRGLGDYPIGSRVPINITALNKYNSEVGFIYAGGIKLSTHDVERMSLYEQLPGGLFVQNALPLETWPAYEGDAAGTGGGADQLSLT